MSAGTAGAGGSRRWDLPDSARAVFRLLATEGPSTRPALGESLSLSKPTMSAAISALEGLDLVASQGSSRGATGRSAVVYSVTPEAGYVLGVDVAATRVRVAAHGLDGTEISSRTERPTLRRRTVTAAATESAIDLTRQVVADAERLGGPLRDVVIAAPTLPSSLDGDDGLRIDGVHELATTLPLPTPVPVTVQNNVNCAAVAEHRLGVARGQRTFIYVQVGVKIGVGIVIDGSVLGGAHGAAGEVAMMPFPWSRTDAPARNALEDYLGSEALMERCAAAWPASAGPVPSDAEELFSSAARGNAAARRAVDEHSRNIGRLVVTVVALLDPRLVVLGGGVGQNQMVLPEVRRTVADLAWDTEVTVGALGDHASVLGAVHLAIGRTLDRIA